MNINMTELLELIKKIGTIHYKYSLLQEFDKFNIFEILRKKDDEVHLHSMFIAELLNPKGSHGMGSIFLKLFIDLFNTDSSSEFCNLEKAIITVEKNIGEISNNYETGGRIDIVIENIDTTIVIENKIYAEDQPKQLLRYYNYNKSGKIIYLTLFGTDPSDDSICNVPPNVLIKLSYKFHINSWIELCIEKTALKPHLRETFEQYKKLIAKLTGQTMQKEEINEIYNLVSQNDNIIHARLIADNWNFIKIKTELIFWEELKNTIEKSEKYKISEKALFSENQIKKIVLKQRGGNPYYGIFFKIGIFKTSEIYFKIERGYGDLFYGIIVQDEHIRKHLNACISQLCDHQFNHIYVGWKHIPDLNFENFVSPITLKMCNQTHRKELIENYWKEIETFIERCKKEFGEEYKAETC